MALRSASTQATGNGTSVSIAKPSGVAAGDIVIFLVSTDVSGKTSSTPTGFTAFSDNGQASPDGHSNFAFWRRFDGGEGATIDCTIGGGGDDWTADAIAFSGRHASNDPVAALTTPNTSANSSPVSVALTGVTAVDGDDIVAWSSLDKTSSAVSWTQTPPTNYTEATDGNLNWVAASLAYRENVSAGATGSLTFTATGGGGQSGYAGYVIRIPAASGTPAVLSSPTPSGTLSTAGSATLGASTDQTSGTGYGVVDTAANISGITAAQVKAGQNNASAAAVASGNVSISASPFSIPVTGLSSSTAYSYAIVQNNANGDSNVVTGTFTTAPPNVVGLDVRIVRRIPG
jgi:hypothetical protein